MPLVDTGLIVRYYIDEAASGQGPSAVLDGSGVGSDFDLTITYDSTDLNYNEISGNRGIENIDTATLARAEKLIDDVSDKVRDDIHGSKTATVEIVVRVDDFSASQGRCFVINSGISNPILGLSGTSGTNARVYFNGTLMRSFDPGSARAVWHIVYDTAQATANDRIKIYKDDTLQSPTIDANPALDATFSINAGSRMFMFNRGDSGYQRSMDGVLFYAAIYSSAFTSGNVTTNDAILGSDDDTPGDLDTAEKRFSMMNFGDGTTIHLLPEQDGAIDLDDRQHLLDCYSGIAFNSPAGGGNLLLTDPARMAHEL